MKSSVGDVQRLLKNIFEMGIQTNADMAVAHEQSLALVTNNAEFRLERVNDVAGRTETSVGRLTATIVRQMLHKASARY